MSLTSQTQTQTPLLPELQAILDSAQECPSLDAWLTSQLTTEHKHMYTTLLQMRTGTQGEPFPVDFDTLWPTVGFSRKDPAKRLLERTCQENSDYKLAHPEVEQTQGGHNRESIQLTLNAAQKFALKADTKQSLPIADFFVRILEVVQNYHMLNLHFNHRLSNWETMDRVLMATVVKGKHYFYIGYLGFINGKFWIKAGYTNDGTQRFPTHKRIFPNGFYLCYLFEHAENEELERLFKQHPLVAVHREDLVCGNRNFTECWNVTPPMTVAKFTEVVPKLAKTIHVDHNRKHEETMAKLAIEMKRLDYLEQRELTRREELKLKMLTARYQFKRECARNISAQHTVNPVGSPSSLFSQVCEQVRVVDIGTEENETTQCDSASESEMQEDNETLNTEDLQAETPTPLCQVSQFPLPAPPSPVPPTRQYTMPSSSEPPPSPVPPPTRQHTAMPSSSEPPPSPVPPPTRQHTTMPSSSEPPPIPPARQYTMPSTSESLRITPCGLKVKADSLLLFLFGEDRRKQWFKFLQEIQVKTVCRCSLSTRTNAVTVPAERILMFLEWFETWTCLDVDENIPVFREKHLSIILKRLKQTPSYLREAHAEIQLRKRQELAAPITADIVDEFLADCTEPASVEGLHTEYLIRTMRLWLRYKYKYNWRAGDDVTFIGDNFYARPNYDKKTFMSGKPKMPGLPNIKFKLKWTKIWKKVTWSW